MTRKILPFFLLLIFSSLVVASEPQQLQQLAKSNDPVAEFVLGNRYFKGDGVPQDYKKARTLWAKAAQRARHMRSPLLVQSATDVGASPCRGCCKRETLCPTMPLQVFPCVSLRFVAQGRGQALPLCVRPAVPARYPMRTGSALRRRATVRSGEDDEIGRVRGILKKRQANWQLRVCIMITARVTQTVAGNAIVQYGAAVSRAGRKVWQR